MSVQDSVPPSTLDLAMLPGENAAARQPPVLIVLDDTKASDSKSGPNITAKVESSSKAKDWDPADFMKDAKYFSDSFGLPNEGLNPNKINDVPESALVPYFGEKTRSGYKLSNIARIPCEEVLHLSQVIDGFDKPVNGVLAHTFVKGVYAERVLKKKVNWAAYASSKLKGQIHQWESQGKGKPEGPPCVRKPRRYNLPMLSKASSKLSSKSKAEVCIKKELPQSNTEDVVQSTGAATSAELPKLDFRDSPPPNASAEVGLPIGAGRDLVFSNHVGLQTDAAGSSLFKFDSDKFKPSISTGAPPSVLLSVVDDCMLATRSSKRRVTGDANKIASHMRFLRAAISDHEESVAKINAESASKTEELAEVKASIARADKEAEELQTAIELELQQEGDKVEGDDNQFLAIMEDRFKKEKKGIEDLVSRGSTIADSLKTCRHLVDVERKRLEALPAMVDRLKAMHSTLEKELQALEVAEKAQLAEYEYLAKVLANPCPPLNPTFVATTTRLLVTQVSCSPCPVCCNGFHCNNWIPASCGHTYHPSCLFCLIGGTWSEAKCLACGEVFINDWLQSWGLPTNEPEVPTTYIQELRALYKKQSALLCKRRQFGEHVQSAQQKSNIQARVELILSSDDTTKTRKPVADHEDMSSEMQLLTPKLEDGTPGKRKGEGQGKGPRKVTSLGSGCPWTS